MKLDEFFANVDLGLPLSNPILIFSLVLFVILFAPMLLDRFRIPHIIGLIISGILLGENGFNILSRDQSFELFGAVGLLYIMFLAGLEIDLTDFKKNKEKSIFFGLMTFIVPMVIGVVSGYFLLKNIPSQSGNPELALSAMSNRKYIILSAVLLASMYASHTLLSYPIVSRFGVTKNRVVSVSIGGTMITTVLALLIFAVIIGFTKGDINSAFWVRLFVSVLIFGLVIAIVFPKIAESFFKHYDDSILQYIFVLAMVFLGGFLAQLAGLEPIIGAFGVGLTLNRFIPRISPLMNRLDFVGNALFIPYFLIGVGMLIDLRVVFSGFTTLIVAVVMCVVATLSKYIAAVLTRRTFGFSKDEGLLIFGLSNAQAAATLAVVTIGYKTVIFNSSTGEFIRFFSDDLLNGTIIMILVTCTISSIATERAARSLAVQQNHIDENLKEGKLVDRILITLYNPETLNSLMDLAVILKEKRSKEPLYALNVASDSSVNSSVDKGKKLLEKAAKIASATDNTVRMIMRYDVNVTSGIIHTIKENNITEVVMGLHHKAHFADSFFGAKTDNLLKATNQMILIYKSIQPINTIKRLVVVVPEKAEFEVGFVKWYDRIKNVCKQIGATTVFFAPQPTLKQIHILAQRNKFGVETSFEVLDDWDDFLILTRELRNNDLFVVLSSRKGAISYNPAFEKLPMHLSKYFADNSFVVLYPEQFEESKDGNMI